MRRLDRQGQGSSPSPPKYSDPKRLEVQATPPSDPAREVSWRSTIWSKLVPSLLDTDEVLSLIHEHETVHHANVSSRQDSTLRAVTDLLVRNIKTNPALFWKLFKSARGHKGSDLPRKLLDRNNVFATERPKVFSEWISAFQRPALDFRLFPELQSWWDHVNTSVSQWLACSDLWDWGDSPILRDELIAVLRRMKKNGAPGLDLITIKLILAVGEPFIDMLLQFFEKVWESECLPSQYLLDVIVPIYKKSCIWRALNYRPISLLQVCATVFLAALYQRVEDFSTTPPPARTASLALSSLEVAESATGFNSFGSLMP